MKKVRWFFMNEDRKIVAMTDFMGFLEEERAIDLLSLQVERGRYILGYRTLSGLEHLYDNARQIV